MSANWLLAYDFSECADAAAAEAAADLALSGGRLLVVHAYDAPARPAAIDISAGSGAFGSWREVETALVAEITHRLEVRATALREAHPAITVEARALEGAPEEVVMQVAEAEGVDRIVVGTHGRTGLQRFFLGSVAQRIARAAVVPVMIVKAGRQDA